MCRNGSTNEPKDKKNKEPNELRSEGIDQTTLVSAMYGPGDKHRPDHSDDRCCQHFSHDVIIEADTSIQRIGSQEMSGVVYSYCAQRQNN